MPKKKNFLGGMQNYNPNNGEYEPDLTNSQGEPVKGFSSFKKSDTENKSTTKDTEVGKTIKYSPFLRQADGSWKKDDTQQKRVKTLNNGLGIETKAQPKEMVYHEQVGKYRLVDIETGTTVGWAKDYDDALQKSNDADFIGAINRAKKVFYEKHPEVKEQSGKPVDYNAKRLGKTEGEMAKKEMEKARKKMEKYWARTDANEHMKSEMDYLLSNFEHDNDKEGALGLAKQNIKKWQKIGFLDTNELRDEKLVYFQKMVDYMEKNL